MKLPVFTLVFLLSASLIYIFISPHSNSSSLNASLSSSLPAYKISLNTVDVFSNTVGFSLPTSWKQAFHDSKGNMTSYEFIPKNSNLNQWTDMVCVQGFKGMGKHASPEDFLNQIVSSYQKTCKGELAYQTLGDTSVGELEAFHGLVTCSLIPNLHQTGSNKDISSDSLQGETGYFTVVRVEDDLLMLHKSMRGDSFAFNNIPLTKSNYAEFIAEFMPLSVQVSDE